MHRIALPGLLALALTFFLATAAAAQNYTIEYAELSIFVGLQFHHDTGGAVITAATPTPGGPAWFIDAVDSTLHSVARISVWEDGSGRIEDVNLGPLTGTFDFVAAGPDPHGAFYLDVLNADAREGRIRLIMSGFVKAPPPPPPPATLKIFVTNPHNGDTVSGTNWVVMWVEGATGNANVFTLSVDGKSLGSQTLSATGPAVIPWTTSSFANGTHTLTGSVQDANGNTGSTSISVIVQN
jgi:hypothetical protein